MEGEGRKGGDEVGSGGDLELDPAVGRVTVHAPRPEIEEVDAEEDDVKFGLGYVEEEGGGLGGGENDGEHGGDSGRRCGDVCKDVKMYVERNATMQCNKMMDVRWKGRVKGPLSKTTGFYT